MLLKHLNLKIKKNEDKAYKSFGSSIIILFS